MPFYKITYSEKYRRGTIHNYGCNFRCRGCSYKLLRREKPQQVPTIDRIKAKLKELDIEAVHFMGGEPTTCPDLPGILDWCKNDLHVITRLGHTNGSDIPTENLDGAYVSFKAFDPALHREYTGQPKEPVYESFTRAFKAGLDMRASAVLIPGVIGLDQIDAICAFVASHDPAIRFHLMGYIPVPGLDWRRPTEEEMNEAIATAKRHLTTVNFSHLTAEEALNTRARDDRFDTKQVL